MVTRVLDPLRPSRPQRIVVTVGGQSGAIDDFGDRYLNEGTLGPI